MALPACLSTAFWLQAAPPAAAPDPHGGQELAARLRSSVPAQSAEYSGTLKIRSREGDVTVVPFTCRIVAGVPTWRVCYETGATGVIPAERLIIIHSTNAPNHYLHARAARPGQPPGEPVALRPDQLATPLAASDFWLLDLGLDFLHWPTQRLLKTEMRKGRVCRLLESLQPNPPPGGYARVLSWIDKETGSPILAEASDARGQLIKEFSLRSFKKVDGRWQLEEMEIRDVRKRSRTRLEFDLNPELVAEPDQPAEPTR